MPSNGVVLSICIGISLLPSCASDRSPEGSAPVPTTDATIVANSSVDEPTTGGSSTTGDDSSIVLLTAKDPGVLDGLIQARYVVADRCAYIDDGDDGVFRPAVWPAGTKVDVDGESIILPDGYVLRLNEMFEAGGGLVEDPESVTLLATAESAAVFIDQCGPSDAAFLVADGLRPFE